MQSGEISMHALLLRRPEDKPYYQGTVYLPALHEFVNLETLHSGRFHVWKRSLWNSASGVVRRSEVLLVLNEGSGTEDSFALHLEVVLFP